MGLVLLLTAIAFQPWPADVEPYFHSDESHARVSEQFNECMARNVRVIDAITLDCLGDEIDRQDARLNRTYQIVMRRLPPGKREKLRKLERAWIVHRDRYCYRIGGGPWRGSLGDVNLHECRLDETIKRTIWLEQYPRRITARA
jgi:uncharacterized protein YecT (DUF1311 family)